MDGSVCGLAGDEFRPLLRYNEREAEIGLAGIDAALRVGALYELVDFSAARQDE